MSKDKCEWIDTGDGEYTTACKNEFYDSGINDEEKLQTLLFLYCPFCGKQINITNKKEN